MFSVHWALSIKPANTLMRFYHNGPYSFRFATVCFAWPLLLWHYADLQSNWCIDSHATVLQSSWHCKIYWILHSSEVTLLSAILFVRSFVCFALLFLHFAFTFQIAHQTMLFIVWKGNYKLNDSPMPTCPAFSSVGVPGPLAGRESAPSVALFIFIFFIFLFKIDVKQMQIERQKKRKKRDEKETKQKWSWLHFFAVNFQFSNTILPICS